jgi:hypothetical protein
VAAGLQPPQTPQNRKLKNTDFVYIVDCYVQERKVSTVQLNVRNGKHRTLNYRYKIFTMRSQIHKRLVSLTHYLGSTRITEDGCGRPNEGRMRNRHLHSIFSGSSPRDTAVEPQHWPLAAT